MKNKTAGVFSFGGVLVAAGALTRIIELIIASLVDSGSFSWRPLYMIMLCLMTGGFTVIAYEKKGKASLFAIMAAVSCLLSTVMSNMSEGRDLLYAVSAVMFALLFASSGAVMLCSKDRPAARLRMAGGAAMLLVAVFVFLLSFGFIQIHSSVICSVLLAAYAIMGAALI